MTAPVLAAAQCTVRAGDIKANIALHMTFMRQAYAHKADFLLFPELSLTGYEPTLAHALAQEMECPLLSPLRRLAQECSMTTVVGLPLRLPGHDKPLIAAFILNKEGSMAVYTKQHLHPGEDQYFSAGHGGDLLNIGDVPVALSVCADFSHATHPADAANQGAQVYAASVLIGKAGYAHDSALLQGYSQRYAMAVLMANHGGTTGGWEAAGRSAFWDEAGRRVASVSGDGDHLLIVSKQSTGWQGFEMPVPLPAAV